MYLISTILFLVFLVLSVSLWSMASIYIDPPSLILILTFTIPILFASGLHRDFFKSLNLMVLKENTFSEVELKRMLQSVKLVIKTLFASGVLGTFIGTIAILSSTPFIFAHFAITMITLLYAIIFIIMLLPIEARIKATIDTF